MANNDWQRLLDELYRLGGYGEYPIEGEGDHSAEFDVAASAGLTGGEVTEAAKPLSRGGLLEDYDVRLPDDPRKMIRLNEHGFKIAHERELGRRQDRTNRYIALFTVALVITSALDAITAVLATTDVPSLWLYGASAVQIIIVITILGLVSLIYYN